MTTNTPGVQINEIDNPYITVRNSPTVPVLCCITKDLPADWPITEPLRVNNWLEFIELYKNGSIGDTTTGFNTENVLHCSMKAYFDNGGGYCYASAMGLSNDDHVDDAANNILALDDVTLIVAAGAKLWRPDIFEKLCGPETTRMYLKEQDFSSEHCDNPYATEDYSGSHVANYHPLLTADWADGKLVSPTAAIAGVICSVDREVGPWKAPANIALKGGLRPRQIITDDYQSRYMEGYEAVNMLRDFRDGRGLVIWGARTTASEDDSEWRYIPVRRLFLSVEKDLKQILAFSVFQPNNQPTWERVRAAIDSYLNSIWKKGGLMGTTAKEAYFIQVGLGVTMDQADIDNGKLIIKIGMAAVRPAEFIILEFTQNMQIS